MEEVSYLDENFEVIATPAVAGYSRQVFNGDLEPIFRRGDVTANGAVQISDAIAVLNFLFQEGRDVACRKAADADDDGSVNVSDAVAILDHLFDGSGPLPEPFSACGEDLTADNLSCGEVAPCRS